MPYSICKISVPMGYKSVQIWFAMYKLALLFPEHGVYDTDQCNVPILVRPTDCDIPLNSQGQRYAWTEYCGIETGWNKLI